MTGQNRPKSHRPPLRLGLMIDALTLPRCYADIVDRIQASGIARIDLVLLAASGERQGERSSALLKLYERWDRRHLASDEDPLVRVDCSARLGGVAVMRIGNGRDENGASLPRLRAAIASCELDVVIDLGSSFGGDLAPAARFGVWRHHPGNSEEYRGGTAGFWEVYEGNLLSAAELHAWTNGVSEPKVLCRSTMGTFSGSPSQNRAGLWWAACPLVLQALEELYERGWDAVAGKALEPRPYQGRKPTYTTPTNWELTRWLVRRLAASTARRLVRRRAIFHWRVAVRVGGKPLADDVTGDLSGFHWIEPPAGRTYADPFLFAHNGATWLFFEDLDYTVGRGRLTGVRLEADGWVSTPVPVLEKPYHLSYPLVFRDGDDVFMIPETAENNSVDLYRCRRFPDDWAFERELFRGRAVDTTVWKDSGFYWFFTTLVDPRSRTTELRLYWSRSLTGAWTSHPANPISRDICNSRAAGAVFCHNGKAIRPSQDGSGHYGRRFTFNEIVALTPERYEERPLFTVNPPPGIAGTHSYTRAGAFEAIDGCVLVPPSKVAR